MEIGKQIKQHRHRLNLSQDELADKIYVTRQTISNWETGKNYPDINSLVLLSTLFQITLDELVKGDLEKMKEHIEHQDIQNFKKESSIFAVLLVTTILSMAPLFYYFKWQGMIVWVILYIITLVYSLRIEKMKKNYDIQTYKEIVAFMNGTRLDEIDRVSQRAIRPYQKILLALTAGVVGFAISFIIFTFFYR